MIYRKKVIHGRFFMTPKEYVEFVKSNPYLVAGSPAHECMHKAAEDARRITCEINNTSALLHRFRKKHYHRKARLYQRGMLFSGSGRH